MPAFAIHRIYQDKEYNWCNAVPIGPNTILTIQHCINGGMEVGDEFSISGKDLTADAKIKSVERLTPVYTMKMRGGLEIKDAVVKVTLEKDHGLPYAEVGEYDPKKPLEFMAHQEGVLLTSGAKAHKAAVLEAGSVTMIVTDQSGVDNKVFEGGTSGSGYYQDGKVVGIHQGHGWDIIGGQKLTSNQGIIIKQIPIRVMDRKQWSASSNLMLDTYVKRMQKYDAPDFLITPPKAETPLAEAIHKQRKIVGLYKVPENYDQEKSFRKNWQIEEKLTKNIPLTKKDKKFLDYYQRKVFIKSDSQNQ